MTWIWRWAERDFYARVVLSFAVMEDKDHLKKPGWGRRL
jgi:hypothetical protein